MKTFSSLCITNTHLNEPENRSKHHTPNERSDVAQKKHKGPASLFGREAEVSVGA